MGRHANRRPHSAQSNKKTFPLNPQIVKKLSDNQARYLAEKKRRGAYFTPRDISDFLANWALSGPNSTLKVLDPTCGDGAFLASVAELNTTLPSRRGLQVELFGFDLDADSLQTAQDRLQAYGVEAPTLLLGDFFDEASGGSVGSRVPVVDAVLGNPPFIRYQNHQGASRTSSRAAAMAQGVNLSGLASSWAATLVHAASFLKPDGRLAMVLPAELLSVGYAAPIRDWLRKRFRAVHLVIFENLQFTDADEQVILLVARGSGGCDALSLHHVRDATDLRQIHIFDAEAVSHQEQSRWTSLLLPAEARTALARLSAAWPDAAKYLSIELGTVTGANKFFTLTDSTRNENGLRADRDVVRVVPPGSRHLRGAQFTTDSWDRLRVSGERVWLFYPSPGVKPSSEAQQYIDFGFSQNIHTGYKCSNRNPWWRTPLQPSPTFFFTYMSHWSPRFTRNLAGTYVLNSMHGGFGREQTSERLRDAIPYVAMNTISRLSAEIVGRTYGRGLLKMEPSEALKLPLPPREAIDLAWPALAKQLPRLNELFSKHQLQEVTDCVDEILLTRIVGVKASDYQVLVSALRDRQAIRHRGRSRN